MFLPLIHYHYYYYNRYMHVQYYCAIDWTCYGWLSLFTPHKCKYFTFLCFTLMHWLNEILFIYFILCYICCVIYSLTHIPIRDSITDQLYSQPIRSKLISMMFFLTGRSTPKHFKTNEMFELLKWKQRDHSIAGVW